jgi:metallo-beta-lactamase class B
MPTFLRNIAVLLLFLSGNSCHLSRQKAFVPVEVYNTKDLVITQLSENAFQHTSFKQTDDFGYVPCNGMVVRDGGETIVFDTPTNIKSADGLIRWIKDSLRCSIQAVIPTHFHDDCTGGLQAFDEAGIPSYALQKTIVLAKANQLPVPKNGFQDSLKLPVGNTYVTARFHGEGHTRDNIVGYFPKEAIMFGGCLIKTLGASQGYIGDANVPAWSGTVAKVKQAYPNAKIVIPGHGDPGNTQLLDYTMQLFKQ